MKNLEKEIVDWQKETFPGLGYDDYLAKLQEEVSELQAAVIGCRNGFSTMDNVSEELADVIIIAAGLIHFQGHTLEKEIRKKMAINRLRKWDKEGLRK